MLEHCREMRRRLDEGRMRDHHCHALYQYQEGFAIEKTKASCAGMLLAILLPLIYIFLWSFPVCYMTDMRQVITSGSRQGKGGRSNGMAQIKSSRVARSEAQSSYIIFNDGMVLICASDEASVAKSTLSSLTPIFLMWSLSHRTMVKRGS